MESHLSVSSVLDEVYVKQAEEAGRSDLEKFKKSRLYHFSWYGKCC